MELDNPTFFSCWFHSKAMEPVILHNGIDGIFTFRREDFRNVIAPTQQGWVCPCCLFLFAFLLLRSVVPDDVSCLCLSCAPWFAPFKSAYLRWYLHWWWNNSSQPRTYCISFYLQTCCRRHCYLKHDGFVSGSLYGNFDHGVTLTWVFIAENYFHDLFRSSGRLQWRTIVHQTHILDFLSRFLGYWGRVFGGYKPKICSIRQFVSTTRRRVRALFPLSSLLDELCGVISFFDYLFACVWLYYSHLLPYSCG